MATDLLSKVLREVRGTGLPEAPYTDGIYFDIVGKTTEDDGLTPRIGAGIYGSMKLMAGDSAVVASIYQDVVTVAAISTAVTDLAVRKLKLDSLYADKIKLDSLVTDKAILDSLYADKLTLDSLLADKAKLDSIFADKAKLDSLFTDKAKLDSLVADKATLDSLYADKITLDRIYVSIANIDRLNTGATVNNIDRLNTGATADSMDRLGDLQTSTAIDILGDTQTSAALDRLNTGATAANIDRLNTGATAAAIDALGDVTTSAALDRLNTGATANNIDTLGTYSANIATVAGAIANVNLTGASIANVNTVAANILDVNNFADTYYGSLSVAPTITTHPTLTQGDLYFDTVLLRQRHYNGTDWIDNPTDLTTTTTATAVTVVSSNGTDAVLSAATPTVAGVQTAADKTKLDGIEALADVTDTINVTAAGALMDSEVDLDIKTLVLPASTTISVFGASLVDDLSAAAALVTLGVTATAAEINTMVLEGDTTTALMQFVIDEDLMTSNLATKVPTQQSVKAYVDAEVAAALVSEMSYKGGYDAALNTPNLDAATPVVIAKGDMYTVTVAGTFFAVAVEVGDMLIAEIALAAVEADWTIVNKNLDNASIKLAYEANVNTNEYDDIEQAKVANITITQPVNLDTIESDTALNNAKLTNVTTNLSTTTTATTVTVVSSDGTDALLPAATTIAAGMLTGADKLILNTAATDIGDIDRALGTAGAIKRYDKILGSLDIIATEYDVNSNLTVVRYTGDDNTTIYYRDVLSYGVDGMDLVKHYYNKGSTVTESASTTLSYVAGNLAAASYVEL